jgi:hypothetical protein
MNLVYHKISIHWNFLRRMLTFHEGFTNAFMYCILHSTWWTHTKHNNLETWGCNPYQLQKSTVPCPSSHSQQS